MTERLPPPKSGPLGPRDTLGQLLAHPALAGFSRRVLPWDDRAYDPALPLDRLDTLLPYHSHVDASVAIAALNRLIDDAERGTQVFYDIYTAAEKQADPGKAHTGLFFLRGRPGAPFALIAPGGGFAYVGSVHEGFPYATAINRHGYNAFVLKYRVGQGGAVATADMAVALRFILANAETLGVGRANYSVWGSSAGARMAAAIGTHGAAAFAAGPPLPRPAVVVMAYTGHSEFSRNDPPTFVAVGERDGIAPAATMAQRVDALRRAGVEVEFHRYPDVGHGFGAGVGTRAEGWLDAAIRFWGRHAPAGR